MNSTCDRNIHCDKNLSLFTIFLLIFIFGCLCLINITLLILSLIETSSINTSVSQLPRQCGALVTRRGSVNNDIIQWYIMTENT